MNPHADGGTPTCSDSESGPWAPRCILILTVIVAAACSATGGKKAEEEAAQAAAGGGVSAGHANTPRYTFDIITHAQPGDTFWDIILGRATAAGGEDNIALDDPVDWIATRRSSPRAANGQPDVQTAWPGSRPWAQPCR